MSQHDYILDNQSGANFRSDTNNALAAIVSANSGATEPTTTYAYQFWADTTSGFLKQRNGTNTAWVTVLNLSNGVPYFNNLASIDSIGFKLISDDDRYYVGTDKVRSEIDVSEASNTTLFNNNTTTSTHFAVDFNHTWQRADGTSELWVDASCDWEVSSNSNGDALAEIELYYYTGAGYSKVSSGGLSTAICESIVGHRNASGTTEQTRGRATFSLRLDNATFERTDTPLTTLRFGGALIDSGATFGIRGMHMIIREVLI